MVVMGVADTWPGCVKYRCVDYGGWRRMDRRMAVWPNPGSLSTYRQVSIC